MSRMLEIAYQEMGVHEVDGPDANPRIMEYFAACAEVTGRNHQGIAGARCCTGGQTHMRGTTMSESLKKSLADQIGMLAVISAEQGLLIADLRAQLKDRDAKLADMHAKLLDAQAKAEQPAQPMGDALPGHEGEANGIAPH